MASSGAGTPPGAPPSAAVAAADPAYAEHEEEGIADDFEERGIVEDETTVHPHPLDGLEPAELAALHATGGTLPQHARSFLPSRYEDAEYRARALGADGRVGQL